MKIEESRSFQDDEDVARTAAAKMTRFKGKDTLKHFEDSDDDIPIFGPDSTLAKRKQFLDDDVSLFGQQPKNKLKNPVGLKMKGTFPNVCIKMTFFKGAQDIKVRYLENELMLLRLVGGRSLTRCWMEISKKAETMQWMGCDRDAARF